MRPHTFWDPHTFWEQCDNQLIVSGPRTGLGLASCMRSFQKSQDTRIQEALSHLGVPVANCLQTAILKCLALQLPHRRCSTKQERLMGPGAARFLVGGLRNLETHFHHLDWGCSGSSANPQPCTSTNIQLIVTLSDRWSVRWRKEQCILGCQRTQQRP